MQYLQIGKYIRKRRISLGISLNNFAIGCDVEPAVLSRIENGKQDIKLNILVKLANGFGQTPSEFLASLENQA